MPHRRHGDDSLHIHDDPVQGLPHASRRYASDIQGEEGEPDHHRRSHSRKRADADGGGRGTREGKHRRSDHKKHHSSRRSFKDEDNNQLDGDARKGKAHRKHKHKTHKRDAHKHREGYRHEEGTPHRSRHHQSSRNHPGGVEDFDEDDEYTNDDVNGVNGLRADGFREGDALRGNVAFDVDDDEEDDGDEEHDMFHVPRERSSSRDGRRGEPLREMLNRHGRSASGRRLDANERRRGYDVDDDVSLPSARHTSRSGRTAYPHHGEDYNRYHDPGDAEYISERSRHSFPGRRGQDEELLLREREVRHRGMGGHMRDDSHDADMGDKYGRRGYVESRFGHYPRSRSLSHSHSRSRLGSGLPGHRDFYPDDGRAMRGDYAGPTGYFPPVMGAGALHSVYPEGAVPNDENSRYAFPMGPGLGPPPGYPPGHQLYQMPGAHPVSAQGVDPRYNIGSYMSGGNMGHSLGPSIDGGMYRNTHERDLHYRPEDANGYGMAGYPDYGIEGYRSRSGLYAGEQGFDGRSEVSDDLGTAERHAARVRRASHAGGRSRRNHRGKRPYGYGRHRRHQRHSGHRSRHHRRKKHSYYSRRNRDLEHSLSQRSPLSQERYEQGEGGQVNYAYLSDEERERLEREGGPFSRQSRFDDLRGEGAEGGDDNEKKVFTKKNALKAGLLALTALAVGVAVRKVVKKRKAKKEKEDGISGEDDDELSADETEDPIAHAFRPPRIPPAGLFNVTVPQSQVVIVERGGRYHRKLDAGSNFIVPCIDKLAYCHSLKELSIPVPYQQCYSKDNVAVHANGIIFMRVEDPVAATYGVLNPYRTVVHLVQTCVRNEIAMLPVHQAIEDRVAISDRILDHVNDACRPWGVRCIRFELQEFLLPEELKQSLDAEAEAERKKRLQILESEAERDAAINKAEAQLQAQIKMSQARQLDIVNQAIGEAHAIEERGGAVANAMRDVAEVIREPGGEQAMQMRIAEQFINAYSNATREPTVQPPVPNDMAANMNSAIGLLNTLGQQNQNSQIPLADLPNNPFDTPSGDAAAPDSASDVGLDLHISSPRIGNGAKTKEISQESTPQMNQVRFERGSSRQTDTSPEGQHVHRHTQVENVHHVMRSPQVRVQRGHETAMSPQGREEDRVGISSPLVQMRRAGNPQVEIPHRSNNGQRPQVRVQHVRQTTRRTQIKVHDVQRTPLSARRAPSAPRRTQD